MAHTSTATTAPDDHDVNFEDYVSGLDDLLPLTRWDDLLDEAHHIGMGVMGAHAHPSVSGYRERFVGAVEQWLLQGEPLTHRERTYWLPLDADLHRQTHLLAQSPGVRRPVFYSYLLNCVEAGADIATHPGLLFQLRRIWRSVPIAWAALNQHVAQLPQTPQTRALDDAMRRVVLQPDGPIDSAWGEAEVAAAAAATTTHS